MIKISYDLPGVHQVRELPVDAIMTSWDCPNKGYLIKNPVSLLISTRNIGPCFGLFIYPDGKKTPIRVAGTFIFHKEPENPAALMFEYRSVNYRVLINFFKISEINGQFVCDFVITGTRPYQDSANVFNAGLDNENINLESLKEILSFGLTLEEKAIFNSEGGFTLTEDEASSQQPTREIDQTVIRFINPGCTEIFNSIVKKLVKNNERSHNKIPPSAMTKTIMEIWKLTRGNQLP